MHIDHGEAFIEKADPKQLQLDITGIAKTGSYIVTMEVGQTLENPQFRFQSTPSLKNISILRLLATGSTVGGGVGTAGLYLGKGFFGGGGMGESLVDKLTVDVGEEISRSGRNTLGVRYELNEDLLLEGEYDKYDAYNVDLIWKILER